MPGAVNRLFLAEGAVFFCFPTQSPRFLQNSKNQNRQLFVVPAGKNTQALFFMKQID
jgi:hypothetical protein